jgi:hypothetical protein
VNGVAGTDVKTNVSLTIEYDMLTFKSTAPDVFPVTVMIPVRASAGIPESVIVPPLTVPVMPAGTFDVHVIAVPAADTKVTVIGFMARPSIKLVEGTFDVADSVFAFTVSVKGKVVERVSLRAVMIGVKAATDVGVPEMSPVTPSIVRPGGRFTAE